MRVRETDETKCSSELFNSTSELPIAHCLYHVLANVNAKLYWNTAIYSGHEEYFDVCLVHSASLVVSNDALRGSTPQASAQVLQWVSFADSEIIPPASAWVFPTLGIMQFNKQVCSVRCFAFGIRLVIFHTTLFQFYYNMFPFLGFYMSRPQNRPKRRWSACLLFWTST